MASRKTLIGIGLLSAAVAAAVVVMVVTKDASEPTAAKQRTTKTDATGSGTSTTKTTPPATATTGKTDATKPDLLPVSHKWTTTVVSATNLVIGDPAGAAEQSSTAYRFEVVKPGTAGAPKAGADDRIVRVNIVGGEGPFGEPVFLRYTRATSGSGYNLVSALIAGERKEVPAAKLTPVSILGIPFEKKISKLPKSGQEKLQATPSTTGTPPALPPAGGSPPGGAPPAADTSVPPVPAGGADTPAAPVT